MTTVGKNHIVTGLRPAVETNHQLGIMPSREIVDECSLATVAESEIDDLESPVFHGLQPAAVDG